MMVRAIGMPQVQLKKQEQLHQLPPVQQATFG
jgi:hypothetical protein